MSWGFGLLAIFLIVGLRYPRADGKAVAGLLIATICTLAYAYHSLGG